MKSICSKILLYGLIMTLSSCNIAQKIVIIGNPGTKIYDTNEKYLTTINNTGTASIKLAREEAYHYFLQAQAPQSDILVPFALDYINHNRMDIEGAIAGYVFTIVASVYLPPLLGLVWGIPVGKRILLSVGEDPDFDYLENQKTNEDLIK